MMPLWRQDVDTYKLLRRRVSSVSTGAPYLLFNSLLSVMFKTTNKYPVTHSSPIYILLMIPNFPCAEKIRLNFLTQSMKVVLDLSCFLIILNSFWFFIEKIKNIFFQDVVWKILVLSLIDKFLSLISKQDYLNEYLLSW